jgi:flagellar L-ring protein FlgH
VIDMTRSVLTIAMALVLLMLNACAATPSSSASQFAPTMPVVAASSQASPGAIYRTQSGSGLVLFADTKAVNVGDLLTVTLVEKTVASSKATTSVTKTSGLEMSAPTLLGQSPQLNGKPLLEANASAGREFSGNGDSAQSNRLEGSVTVTVAERLPNGNLIIRGQKQLRLNQGDEYIWIQGIVRPADISPDNTVLSSRIADARIAYSGRGALAKSNVMGWMSRFFQSSVFPF